MGGKKRRFLVLLALGLALTFVGAASAYALGTIWLKPGECTTVHGQKVCARKVKPKTVVRNQTTTVTTTHTVTATQTVTTTQTVTVYPSATGQTFSGNGDSTLAPLTLSQGDEVNWTSQGDAYGNTFLVSSSPSDSNYVQFDNGNSSTSGSTYIPPGSYTLSVIATGAWTIAF
jgi:hypothetical protein